MGCHAAQAVEDVIGDVVATATGNPELIPLINAGVSAANGGGVKGALTAGVESLAGQELAGAVGIGEGNSFVNGALGFNDTPGGLGLPDIGGGINDALKSVGSAIGLGGDEASTEVGAGTTTPGGAPSNPTTGQATGAPSTTTSTAPSSGAPVGAGQVGDLGNTQIDTQAGGAQPSTSASPGLGTLGSAASTAIGAESDGFTPQESSFLNSAQTSAANTNAAGSIVSSGGAAPAASPSFGSQVESAAIKGALPLGSLAYEAIKGPSKLSAQATALETSGAATAPLLGLETSAANEASTGQLTPTQEANIQQGVQSQQNQLIQQLAGQGITNPTKDSRYIQGMQQIQQWALQQQQAYITQAIQTATAAGGAASNNIATVANEQVQQDTDFQNALAAAFGALGGGSVNINASRPAA